MEYEGATRRDLEQELALAGMAIRREEKRIADVRKILAKLDASGQTCVGEPVSAKVGVLVTT